MAADTTNRRRHRPARRVRIPHRAAEPERLREIAERLTAFYRAHGRTFDWRAQPTFYGVAVAETLLRKTRAGSVLPIYRELLRRHPCAASLAGAETSALERLLVPLGLSRLRAVQLKRLGAALAGEAAGLRDRGDLVRLPGIGPYGASAISAFVFGAVVGIVDANARRVFQRLFRLRNLELPRLQAIADRLARAARDPGAMNYGLLDLAALICTPRAPRCPACPLLDLCDHGARRLAAITTAAARERPQRAR